MDNMPVSGKDADIPEYLTTLPPIKDALQTESSLLQDKTVQACLPLLAGRRGSSKGLMQKQSSAWPRLEREKHVKFLGLWLEEFDADFVGYDASRPWIVYWALTGLCLLGEDVTKYRERSLMMQREAGS